MRATWILWRLAACLPLLSLAAETVPTPDERALREECSVQSQAGMRECLAQKVADSQTLAQWDEDARYIGQARTRLSASGKEFPKYREAQCGFLASLGGGAAGNAVEIRRLACAAELNDRRAGQLRDAVSELPLK